MVLQICMTYKADLNGSNDPGQAIISLFYIYNLWSNLSSMVHMQDPRGNMRIVA